MTQLDEVAILEGVVDAHLVKIDRILVTDDPRGVTAGQGSGRKDLEIEPAFAADQVGVGAADMVVQVLDNLVGVIRLDDDVVDPIRVIGTGGCLGTLFPN